MNHALRAARPTLYFRSGRAEVRADYREQSEKLHQAWELTKSALH
jgi:hypothetical protein